MAFHVGITATRYGMTEAQHRSYCELLAYWTSGTGDRELKFHHGDCVNGDVQGAIKARELGWWIIGHPSSDPTWRAFFRSDELFPPAPPLHRNRVIVGTAHRMIACPNSMVERRRSGTWATVRYTRALGLPLALVLPDGSITRENSPFDLRYR